MRAAQLWAVYSGAFIGSVVESADEKFAALAESEQNAWLAVEAAIPVTKPAEAPKVSLELPKPL